MLRKQLVKRLEDDFFETFRRSIDVYIPGRFPALHPNADGVWVNLPGGEYQPDADTLQEKFTVYMQATWTIP
jgi:hypothetical protein